MRFFAGFSLGDLDLSIFSKSRVFFVMFLFFFYNPDQKENSTTEIAPDRLMLLKICMFVKGLRILL